LNMLIIQRQPNRWSCLLASFATILQAPIEHLIREIGHDGSEKPSEFDIFGEPFCRRSFHIQEMIDCCDRRGYSVTPIDAAPVSVVQLKQHVGSYAYPLDMNGNAARLLRYLEGRLGVITGRSLRGYPHAVAWDGQQVLDPASGEHYGIHLFTVQTFWCVQSKH
jgi:hypothetical protein